MNRRGTEDAEIRLYNFKIPHQVEIRTLQNINREGVEHATPL